MAGSRRKLASEPCGPCASLCLVFQPERGNLRPPKPFALARDLLCQLHPATQAAPKRLPLASTSSPDGPIRTVLARGHVLKDERSALPSVRQTLPGTEPWGPGGVRWPRGNPGRG